MTSTTAIAANIQTQHLSVVGAGITTSFDFPELQTKKVQGMSFYAHEDLMTMLEAVEAAGLAGDLIDRHVAMDAEQLRSMAVGGRRKIEELLGMEQNRTRVTVIARTRLNVWCADQALKLRDEY